ncbi:uncharacterized protein C11orf24 homolog isoform 1-T1 [Anableps anableps]
MNLCSLMLQLRSSMGVPLLCFLLLLSSISLIALTMPESGDTTVNKTGTVTVSLNSSNATDIEAKGNTNSELTKDLVNGTSFSQSQQSSFNSPPIPAFPSQTADNGSSKNPFPSPPAEPVGTSRNVLQSTKMTSAASTTPQPTKTPAKTTLSTTTNLSPKPLSTTPQPTKLSSRTPIPSFRTPQPTKPLSTLPPTASKTVENPPKTLKATSTILPTGKNSLSSSVVPTLQSSTRKSTLSPTSFSTAATAMPLSRTIASGGHGQSSASATRVAVVEVAGAALTWQLVNTASLLAVLLFGLLFFLVTVAVFVTQVYESYRRKDYTQVDYLINGMYSDSGV